LGGNNELEKQRGHKGGAGAFTEGWCAQTQPDRDDSIERSLAHADSRLGALIHRVVASGGPRRFKISNASSHFDAIARAIIYQQLSKKAAASIYARYLGVFGGPPTPEQVIAAQPGMLRQVGLSASKARYLQSLASSIVSGELDLSRVEDQSDDIVVAQLTSIPGIGVWTAQMFLMFRLRRLDVLPINDVGVQRGLQLAHGLSKPPAPRYVERAGRRWAPFRSIACLYLWAALDLDSGNSERS
jgi:DNA-3-methyladenine glycosylase II